MASSKSRLYEICAAKHWQPPSFECCEDGPGHKKLYAVKVTIEVQLEGSTMILECHGAPKSKKKMAEQHATEGALWYLMHLGIINGHN